MAEFFLIVAGVLVPFFAAIYWVSRYMRNNQHKHR